MFTHVCNHARAGLHKYPGLVYDYFCVLDVPKPIGGTFPWKYLQLAHLVPHSVSTWPQYSILLCHMLPNHTTGAGIVYSSKECKTTNTLYENHSIPRFDALQRSSTWSNRIKTTDFLVFVWEPWRSQHPPIMQSYDILGNHILSNPNNALVRGFCIERAEPADMKVTCKTLGILGAWYWR